MSALRTAALVLLCLGGPLLLSAVPPQSAHAEDEAVRPRWQTLEAQTVRRLHGLAKWARGAKLFGQRADVLAGLLRMAPDDSKARKWLKFTRTKDGAWVRKRKWSRPRDMSREAEAFGALRKELWTWFVGQAEELRELAEDEDAWRVRAAIVQAALAVDPSSQIARDWNREVRDTLAGKPAWILAETLSARKRHAALKDTAERALKAVPTPKAGTASQADRRGGVRWTHTLDSARAHVVGTTSKEELTQIVRNVEALWPLLRVAFGQRAYRMGKPGRYGVPGLTIYVVDSVELGNQFHAAHPEVTARRLEFCAPLVAVWLRGRTAVVVKSPQAPVRLEAAPKQVLFPLVRRLTGLDQKRAYLAEGMQLYLTWMVTRTRLIYTVNDVEQKYAEAEKPVPDYLRKMSDDNADWFALGRDMLRSPDKPDLFLMSGKDYNHLTTAEVLYGYCLAAYIIEGWPDEALAFFRAVSSSYGTDLDRVCLDTLGFDARTLERRLLRWLTEIDGE